MLLTVPSNTLLANDNQLAIFLQRSVSGGLSHGRRGRLTLGADQRSVKVERVFFLTFQIL